MRALLGNVPLFGICLGHQILGRALGLDTYKLRFGHHGANHPVRHEAIGPGRDHQPEPQLRGVRRIGRRSARGNIELTHVNLNDGVVEGLRVAGERAFSVQYHPEAGPGPHDARYLFDDFTALMEASR